MDVPHLTEDEMAEIKKEALERLRPYLCDKITADRHYDYLRSKKILTREDTEEISWKVTGRQRTGKLLDYLAENPKGLDTLIESIQYNKCADFLIAKITDEVQKLKNERIESLKAGGTSPTKCTGATNDLSRSLSNESNYEKGCGSTLPYQPEGDWNPSTCSTLSSLNVPHTLPLERDLLCGSVVSSSSILPKPGDPGAPPLPDELQEEPDGASGGSTSSDSNFQPLRSRCIPQSGPHLPSGASR